ncbi:homoserine kinase [Macrococcus lamae]|uniref:Homoserine kinase n=1 Tax=Macrococcus lamae TaxID=198484 RepID=A0A4R6BSW0_9STAP|nr:homoserine kinase [Macrococcus lamae]TDM05271.1 homoserine kinase [Macrococcus lamae]
MKIKVKVPASTSNLGPGFDSIGMAIDSYLEIEASISESWVFSHKSEILSDLPVDETHYIARMVNHFCRQLNVEPFCLKVTMTSDIPLARGLGSSGSALIASLLIVNVVRELNLTTDELIQLLTAEEGHPDNVVPSLIGGLVAGFHRGESCYYQPLPVIDWPMFVVIPNYELKTADARDALPQRFNFEDSVKASAISNVLVASLSQKNYDLAGQMMMQDVFHEPFRKHLIKDYDKLRELLGNRGYVFLSGAGPTLFIMTKPGESNIKAWLQHEFSDYEIRQVKPDNIGAICNVME